MKSFRYGIIFVLLLLLTGCTIPVRRGLLPREPRPTPQPTGDETVLAQLDEPFTLQPGQWATLDAADEFSIQFQAVPEDSRCPARVNCAWSGEALVQIVVRMDGTQDSTGDKVAFELTTNPAEDGATVEYQGYSVALVDVQPYPQQEFASDEIDADEYRVTFMISKSGPEATATVQPTTMPAPPPRAQPTPISGVGQTLAVALQQPFQLNKGQTAVIESEDFQLTFRSVTEDAGCFSPNDCSLMTFDGTLAAQKGDETELMSIMASIHAGSSVDLEFAGYTIELRAIQQIEGQGHVATFVVVETAAQQAQTWPDAQPTLACERFTPFAAAAILQEEVQASAFANLRFGPLPAEHEDAHGLCGYASTAFTADKTVDYTVPHLATALEADHAVVAARLAGVDALELLPIINVIQAANPNDAALDSMLLATMLMAGDNEGVIERLYDSVQNTPSLHTELVDGLGDQALWAWQTFEGGHFAALIVLDRGEFTVVAALLGESSDERDVQPSMSVLASRIAR